MNVAAAAGSLKVFEARVHTSDIAGRAAICIAKAATEMRSVVKADVIADRSYIPMAVSRLAKHAIGAS
jgi:hypothetical protein